jgi:hypothetical protein
LKKSIRQYLDTVAVYVLNPRSPEELLAMKPIAMEKEEEEIDDIQRDLQGQDLFVDSDVQAAISYKSNVISLSDQDQEQPALLSDAEMAAKPSRSTSTPRTKEFRDDGLTDDLESALASLKL